MSVRLTQKKQKAILAQVDSIMLHYRLQIFQQLTPRIDALSTEAIRRAIDQMRDQLLREVMPLFDELLADEVLSLPFQTKSKAS